MPANGLLDSDQNTFSNEETSPVKAALQRRQKNSNDASAANDVSSSFNKSTGMTGLKQAWSNLTGSNNNND